MDDLKPCPFCGGEAKHYHHSSHGGWSNTDSVCCTNEDCGCGTCLHETEASAIAAWNTRADALATRDARIAELTERNEKLEHLFDIQWKRTREAGELWRQAHPGNELVSPDLGELVKWLMDRATAAEERLKEAERVIAPFAEEAKKYERTALGPDIDHWALGENNLTLGDIRAARAFLAKETADEPS